MGCGPAVAANAVKFNNPGHLNSSPTTAVVTSDAKTYGKTAQKATSKIHSGTTLHMIIQVSSEFKRKLLSHLMCK